MICPVFRRPTLALKSPSSTTQRCDSIAEAAHHAATTGLPPRPQDGWEVALFKSSPRHPWSRYQCHGSGAPTIFFDLDDTGICYGSHHYTRPTKISPRPSSSAPSSSQRLQEDAHPVYTAASPSDTKDAGSCGSGSSESADTKNPCSGCGQKTIIDYFEKASWQWQANGTQGPRENTRATRWRATVSAATTAAATTATAAAAAA